MTTALFFIITAILAYALAFVFFYRKDIGNYLTPPKRNIPTGTIQKTDFSEIIGKTQTVLRQQKPSDAKQRQVEKPMKEAVIFTSPETTGRSAIVEESEFSTVFSETPKPISLAIEAEYEEDDALVEEEEISCYTGTALEGLAAGVDFEEMNNLVQVISEKTDTPEQEQEAMETLLKVGQTDLFEQMLLQIKQGHTRVEAMLNKYESETKPTPAVKPEPKADDFQNFELNSYL